MTRKLIIHDGRAERELVLLGTLTVGRDPSCHISDLDPLLSRKHAEFVTTASSCTVRDLGSRNGMLVNGLKVKEQQLKEGDLVQVGHLQMRYAEDLTVSTPDSIRRSHATTAHEAATIAASAASLEDTRPHPQHAHAGHHVDEDITRLPGAKSADDEPTMAPQGRAASDEDATVAPTRKTTPAADLDATFVAGARLDLDLDATGVGRTAPAAAAAGVKPSIDLDRTIAPGSIDLDATFVPGAKSPLARPVAMPAMEARLTAGADLRITAATPGCRAHFNVAPDTLVGRPLGEVLAEGLRAAAADGPTELTIAVDRSPLDRSLIVILKAVPVAETVS